MQAPRNTYTIREGSLEEKTEEDGAAEVTAAGHPAPARTSGASPDIRRPARTSDASAEAGHPASPRKSGKGNRSTRRTAIARPDIRPVPGHPASHERPDIRPPARTSGACLRAESGQRPMYPSPTYPFVDLDYIYSSTSS